MILLREPSQIASILDPDIRPLLEMRFGQLGSVQGFIVVEPGDSVEDLEIASGCPILRNLFDEVRFPDEDFVPSFDLLEDGGGCYEMVFDSGEEATVLIIPKREGVCPALLALCELYAVPV